jgi:hypothetical protein
VIVHSLKKAESNRTERKNIGLITDRTRKIVAPEIVKPNFEPMEVRKIIDLLNDSRAKFLEVLSAITDESKLADRSARHPVFGELPLEQWIELLYLHEQRHVEQVMEIKLSIGERK